jgi:hypothetical protein
MEVPDVPSRSAANTDNPNLGKTSSLDDQTGKVVRLQRQRDGRSLRQSYPLEYNAWRAMRDRVRTEGAAVHERWEDFANFLDHMGPKPRGDFSLDRIDPRNPMYGPGLCEWRDKKHQSRNRNNVHLLTDLGLPVRDPLLDLMQRPADAARTELDALREPSVTFKAPDLHQ